MKRLSIKEIAAACGGRLINPSETVISHISTDSRDIKEGSLFIPIVGEKFDGHSFIEDTLKKGAASFLSQKEINTDKTYVLVEDTLKALGDIAAYYRGLFDIPVVGITGSVGKTTTKDMIAAVLSVKYNVVKTKGNFNNHIGLPLTVFGIDETTQAAVLEMGMNHFGEISYLGRIAKPTTAVITNSGVSHIENLGSREGILKAKCEIFESLSPMGKKILNGDCNMLSTLRDKEDRTVFYGLDPKNDIYAEDIRFISLEETEFKIVMDGEKIPVRISSSGKHMVQNALGAAAVGRELGLDHAEIAKGLESFTPGDKRMDIIKTDRYTIINDTYNANPQSVKAGLDVIAPLEGRSAAILGEMLELGENSKKFHREVGEYAGSIGIDLLCGIGNENVLETTLGASFGGVKKVFYFKTKEEFFENVKKVLKKNDTVLIKASRGAKFEEITDKLKK